MSPGSAVPPSDWLEILGKVGGTITAVCTFFACVIGLDRKIEGMRKQLDGHDKAIKDIAGVFTDSDGNPRFVTVILCDKKEEKCGLHYNEKFAHVGERITALVVEISELRKDMKTTQDETLSAILKAIKEK